MFIFKIKYWNNAVDWFKFFIDDFIPGAITPPSYTPFLIISKVVAVPKSIIKQFLNFLPSIEFTILSEPSCFIFLIFNLINFFKLRLFISKILNLFFLKQFLFF